MPLHILVFLSGDDLKYYYRFSDGEEDLQKAEEQIARMGDVLTFSIAGSEINELAQQAMRKAENMHIKIEGIESAL